MASEKANHVLRDFSQFHLDILAQSTVAEGVLVQLCG
jgi:hypothetical protein